MWRSGPLFYLTSIDVRNDSVNEAPMIRRYIVNMIYLQ